MNEIVLETIRRHDMLARGDSVIVALSGGADSVALFHLLLGFRREFDLELYAAHLNHGLRGEDADADESFVQELCQKHGVELFVRHAHMAEGPKPQGEGTEEWGRGLRYAFFEEQAEPLGAKVATGHTRSDNAETVLFNAARGSGPRGLSGIAPVRGRYIRPLLGISRGQVRQLCKENGWAYRDDATNDQPLYARNVLRLTAMPALEQAHPGAERALARMAGDMRELDTFLLQQAEALLQTARATAEDENIPPGWRLPVLDCEALRAAPAPVRLRALALLAGRAADRAALGRMEEVVAGRRPAAQLPGGKTARRAGGRLQLTKTEEGDPLAPWEHPLEPGAHTLPGGYRLEVEIQTGEGPWRGFQKKAKKDYTFRADYDKIDQYGITLRTRRPGDRFEPAGRGVTKSLKKWMNEEGIDAELRGLLPVLAQNGTGRILWVFGAGFCEGLAATAETKTVLCIHARWEPPGEPWESLI